MHFKQKLAYMALGCLFTIIGYTLASLSGNPVNAQGDKSSPTVIDEIVCRSLRVVNADGKTIVSIDTDSNGGYMHIRHASGEEAITMAIADKLKEGFVQVWGKDQKGFIQLDAGEDGGRMVIFNKSGKNVLQASASKYGSTMTISNKGGKNVLEAGASNMGEGFVQVLTKDEKGLIQLTADEYGGAMVIFNNGGKNVLQAGVSDTGGGGIITKDKHGYETGQLP
jgi:hypothetical protein